MIKRIAFLLCFLPAFCIAQNSWEKKTSFPGSKRARGVTFSIASRGYYCCGEDTLDAEMNDLWEYDPGSDSWTQKANLPGPGRRDAVGFAIGNKGYVGTGIDASEAWMGTPLSDWYEYNPSTNMWQTRAAFPGGFGWGIYFAAGFATSTKGYVCCGKIGASQYSNELWEFNPASNSWQAKPAFPGGVRYGQMSFVINNIAYVGCGTDENWFTHDFWSFNPSTNMWTQKADFPGSNRSFGSAFSLFGKGYMGMGTDGGYRDDWFEYDVTNNAWNIIANYGSEGRRSAPAFVITGAAYVALGKGASGKHRDLWQYMPYTVGMEEFGEAQVNIYPNPATDVINVTLSEDFVSSHGDLSLRLISVDGKIVHEEALNGNSSARILNDNWADGVYLLQLNEGNNTIGSSRVIINQ